VAYKDMHIFYEAEQKRADRLSRSEAIRELRKEENSSRVRKHMKKGIPKDRMSRRPQRPNYGDIWSYYHKKRSSQISLT
jgi:hypothetical protein